MSAPALEVVSTGMVTAVGLNAPAACAAIRARLTNPVETQFVDEGGEPLMSYPVPTEKPWRGALKLQLMAASAISECLADVPREEWKSVPLLLCVAEKGRPGRDAFVDEELFRALCALLETEFAPGSAVIARGRAGVAVALHYARKLLYQGKTADVLIAGVDSLLSWPALRGFQAVDRLLTSANSNGFIPGEAAAAVRVRRAEGGGRLRITGLGFSTESAPVESEEPLRGEGLARAMTEALKDAGCEMHDLDFRITDLSGEQYYFKEATLACSRLLRRRKEDFQIWHPAECVGEVGAAAGVICLAYAEAAAAGGYAPGPGVLLHMGTDDGARACIVAFSS